AGSYRLSDFENINFFNGSLNFSLPLVDIHGRGEAAYTMSLPIERHWRVDTDDSDGGTLYMAISADWTTVIPSFGAGRMEARKSSDNVATPTHCDTGGWAYSNGLTRLTFKKPDGTEYEFRDTLKGGEPISRNLADCYPYVSVSRGDTFITADGGAATFVSQTDIYDDYPNPIPIGAPEPVTGELYFRDGTRDTIDGGNVTWIRDQNVNEVHIWYTGATAQAYRVLDSLNREVLVSYRPNGASYDEITYKGFGGKFRKVRINYAM